MQACQGPVDLGRTTHSACLGVVTRKTVTSAPGASFSHPDCEPKNPPKCSTLRQRPSKRLCLVRAASGSSKEPQRPKDVQSIQRLPIFPLGVVAMPYVPNGLNIFEARYRVLFNTLLSGADGLDEGLVNHNSPFCGSRMFGMCLITRQGLTSVGTTLHIDRHLLRPDGQMAVTSRGGKRFRIQSVVEETPVLICDVEMLQGDDTQSAIAQDIAGEVRRLFKDLIALNAKISSKQVVAGDLNAPEIDDAAPEQLSYVIASMFSLNPILQQSLLEETATLDRLRKERDLLQNTLNYQSATSALKSAFASPSAPKPDAAASSPEPAAASSSDIAAASASDDSSEPPASSPTASDSGSPAAPEESQAQPDRPAGQPAAENVPEQEEGRPPQAGPD